MWPALFLLGEVASLQALPSSSCWTTIFIKPQYMGNMMPHRSMGEENCLFMGCSGHVRPGACGAIHLKGVGCFPNSLFLSCGAEQFSHLP